MTADIEYRPRGTAGFCPVCASRDAWRHAGDHVWLCAECCPPPELTPAIATHGQPRLSASRVTRPRPPSAASRDRRPGTPTTRIA